MLHRQRDTEQEEGAVIVNKHFRPSDYENQQLKKENVEGSDIPSCESTLNLSVTRPSTIHLAGWLLRVGFQRLNPSKRHSTSFEQACASLQRRVTAMQLLLSFASIAFPSLVNNGRRAVRDGDIGVDVRVKLRRL